MIKNNAPIWYDEQHAADLLSPLDEGQRAWLLDSGSLTRRLRACTRGAVEHDLRYAGWAHLLADEVALMPAGQQYWVREIDWRLQGCRWVAARVVIPEVTLTAELRNVGGRSLGEILFADPTVQRGPFEFACLMPGHPCHQLASAGAETGTAFWARRSLFYRQAKALLVTEVFLPAFLAQALADDEAH